jgi:hypothetical protein
MRQTVAQALAIVSLSLTPLVGIGPAAAGSVPAPERLDEWSAQDRKSVV